MLAELIVRFKVEQQVNRARGVASASHHITLRRFVVSLGMLFLFGAPAGGGSPQLQALGRGDETGGDGRVHCRSAEGGARCAEALHF